MLDINLLIITANHIHYMTKPAIPAFRRLRSLDYIASSRPTMAIKQDLFWKKKKKTWLVDSLTYGSKFQEQSLSTDIHYL